MKLSLRLFNQSSRQRPDSGRRIFLKVGTLGTGSLLLAPISTLSNLASDITSTGAITTATTSHGVLPGMVHYFLRGLEDTTGMPIAEIKKDSALRQLTIRTFSGWQHQRDRVLNISAGEDLQKTYDIAFQTMEKPFKYATNIAGSIRGTSKVQTTSSSRGKKENHSDVKEIKSRTPTKTKDLNLEIRTMQKEMKSRKIELERQKILYEDWVNNGVPFDRIPGTTQQIQEVLQEMILKITDELKTLEIKEEEVTKATRCLELEPRKKKAG